jgi:CheY-like chemotaxis protein
VDQFIEFVKAIGLIAWPALAAFAVYKLLPFIQDYLTRGNVKFKIGNMELTLEQATESISSQVKDLQDKVLEIERKILLVGAPNVSVAPAGAVASGRRNQAARILWVDDNPSRNAIQVDKLTKDGISIEIATTTAQAVEKFEGQDYDLIISDMLRIENGAIRSDAGIQLATKIRERDPKIPIFIFTTYQSNYKLKERAQSAGINTITNSTVELYQHIDSVLGMNKNAN